MSVGLLVVGSIACLLVMGLLGALYVLTKVEGAHEERMGIRTADRPHHAGKSGDIHLFLSLPEADRASSSRAIEALGPEGAVSPERFADLVALLRDLFGRATHARADYGHFRRIRAQGVASSALVYVNVRSRKPITQMLELGSRAQWQRTLDELSALSPSDVVEAFVELQKPSTDPAAGKPVPLA